MNNDLKIIKKVYGEKMMHLCRKLFSTILDNHPGFLSSLMTSKFAPNRYLYDDLIYYAQELREYILWQYHVHKLDKPSLEENNVLDPVTLLKQVGYTLYECTCEEDIQKFKKYYAPDEELCTFTYGKRLSSCYVYFAIKDNANELKRSDFVSPSRQDEYGTSVISIQFTRDDSHALSIKNRYNHTVSNPDATFSNNLDNIIPGLTQSFAKHYGMIQKYSTNNYLDLKGYAFVQGKWYKYNQEINNVYYCPNNIVIDNFKVTEYAKEKYLVIDYFIIDLVHKTITSTIQDSFCQMFNNIKKITIVKNGHDKVITVVNETGETILIKINKYNQIISLKNNNILAVDDNFLRYNRALEELFLDNVRTIGNKFLMSNVKMDEICLPSCISVGDDFMYFTAIHRIDLPRALTIGNNFSQRGCSLEKINLPNVISIKDNFLDMVWTMEEITLPKVEKIGDNFMAFARSLRKVFLPKVLVVGQDFCYAAKLIDEVRMPNILEIGPNFLKCNQLLEMLDTPKLSDEVIKAIGNDRLIKVKRKTDKYE